MWSEDAAGLGGDVPLEASITMVTWMGMPGTTTTAPEAGKVQVKATVEPVYLREH